MREGGEHRLHLKFLSVLILQTYGYDLFQFLICIPTELIDWNKRASLSKKVMVSS